MFYVEYGFPFVDHKMFTHPLNNNPCHPRGSPDLIGTTEGS